MANISSIYDQMVEAYARCTSYHDRGTVVQEWPYSASFEGTFETWFLRPNRLKFVSKKSDSPNPTLILTVNGDQARWRRSTSTGFEECVGKTVEAMAVLNFSMVPLVGIVDLVPGLLLGVSMQLAGFPRSLDDCAPEEESRSDQPCHKLSFDISGRQEWSDRWSVWIDCCTMLLREYSLSRRHSADDLRSAAAFAASRFREEMRKDQESELDPKTVRCLEKASERDDLFSDIQLFGRVTVCAELNPPVDPRLFGSTQQE